MTYEEAVQAIDSLETFRAAGPGLERMQTLLAKMGNPEKKLRYIHVAGTNGKGSTCVMLSEILKAAGYRTGLYISPHVVEFTERMQLNGEEIPREELVSLVEEYLPLVLSLREGGCAITEFEFITAIAFAWFAQKGCDIVVLEVGMGGRFDATNVIPSALVSVICSISLDHTKILGDTVEKIAFEKAGILKEGGVCVCYGDQPRGAVEMIKITAELQHNRFLRARPGDLSFVDADFSGIRLQWKNGLPLKIRLLGEHQIQNTAVVLAVIEELRKKGWELPDSALQEGFAAAAVPARVEVLSLDPLVILDGAHNPGGTKALAQTMKTYNRRKKVVGIMGMLKDKDAKEAIRSLEMTFSKVYTLTPESYRALPAQELADAWESYKIPAEAVSSPEEAVELAFREAMETKAGILCCGSLYLAGELRPLLQKKLRNL